MAYVTAGPAAGPVVLLLHGEPAWSFPYRSMLPVLVEAGFRVIVPDLVGFGRSDKPAEQSDLTFERHVQWLSALFEALDLRDVALLGHDWGGAFGLGLVADEPGRFSHLVMSDTGMPNGDTEMPQQWWDDRRTIETSPDLHISEIIPNWFRNHYRRPLSRHLAPRSTTIRTRPDRAPCPAWCPLLPTVRPSDRRSRTPDMDGSFRTAHTPALRLQRR
jgi:pimeloyl-ACP methyl ester carboxylesterase